MQSNPAHTTFDELEEESLDPASTAQRPAVRRKHVAVRSGAEKDYASGIRENASLQELQICRAVAGVDLDGAVSPVGFQQTTTIVGGSELYTKIQQLDNGQIALSSTAASTASSSTLSNPIIAETRPTIPTKSSSFQKAYREARHFAGGLIAHPSESTRNFSVLRHSHGLVFYQGAATTVAISIFANAPLPPDRTIWLQSKGWSGKTGMRLKALVGRDGSWLNVTPATSVLAEQLDPSDERAWQRDIGHFQKRSNRKIRERHLLRETAMIRIPAEAGDGYFQLMLCLGEKEKVLCPSPTFRLLSTSASMHSIKGASLSTLPLEMGAMALTMYAKNTAGRVVGPVTSAMQSRAQTYLPSTAMREAAKVSYHSSGISNTVSSGIARANTQYEVTRERSFMSAAVVDNIENGPQTPYPICFSTRTTPTKSSVEFLPMTNLAGTPEHVKLQLRGYYFGWARFRSAKKNTKESDVLDGSWMQAIVSATAVKTAELARVSIANADKKTMMLYVIDEFQSAELEDLLVDIQILGFIRPDSACSPSGSSSATLGGTEAADDQELEEMEMMALLNDIQFTQAILDQPAWSAVRALSEDNPSRNVLERASSSLADVRMKAQRQVDRVPLHKVGVRREVDGARDRAVVANGFYIVR